MKKAKDNVVAKVTSLEATVETACANLACSVAEMGELDAALEENDKIAVSNRASSAQMVSNMKVVFVSSPSA